MALELPPVAGMMAGFSLLQFFEFYLMKTAHQELGDMPNITTEFLEEEQRKRSYAIFEKVGRLEWDLNPCLISPKEPLNNSGFLPVKPEWGRFFQFSGSKARGLAHG